MLAFITICMTVENTVWRETNQAEKVECIWCPLIEVLKAVKDPRDSWCGGTTQEAEEGFWGHPQLPSETLSHKTKQKSQS